MWYVYIIRSTNFPEQEYIGATADLKRRLAEHNAGKSSHTAKFKPWHLIWYCAFRGVSVPESRYSRSPISLTGTPSRCPRSQGGFGLDIALEVSLPGLAHADAEALVAKAHQVGPYSNATRNNVDVRLTVV
jgi:hypothetical protein